MARTSEGFCQLHDGVSWRGELPEPENIILRFQLTPELANEAQKAGIRVAERSTERQAQLSTVREENAKARWGRTVTKTGVLVFGTEELVATSMQSLVSELRGAGFEIADAHIVWWAATGLDHLVLSFSKKNAELKVDPIYFYRENMENKVFKLRIYHNPPDLGQGGHNANYSMDAKLVGPDTHPIYELHYRDGDWVNELIQSPIQIP